MPLLTEPLVSVVTPSYHQVAFLETTICSVLEQDYPHLEYIIIDGGSTDGSVDIIRKYQNRLAYWVSERDRGQSHTINKGLAHSHGEIVAWLNSDDFYRPGAVSRAVEALVARPEAGMICGNCDRIDAGGRLLTTLRPSLGSLAAWLEGRCSLPQPAVFMRAGALKQAGQTVAEDLEIVMDYDLWLRMLAVAQVAYLDGPALAVDREYPARKTNALHSLRMREYLMVLNRFYQQHGEREDLQHVRRRAFAVAYFRMASAALSEGRAYPDGLRWLAHSLALDPGPAWRSRKHTGGIVKHGLRQLAFRPGKATT